jgi:hypothetical protein
MAGGISRLCCDAIRRVATDEVCAGGGRDAYATAPVKNLAHGDTVPDPSVRCRGLRATRLTYTYSLNIGPFGPADRSIPAENGHLRFPY